MRTRSRVRQLVLAATLLSCAPAHAWRLPGWKSRELQHIERLFVQGEYAAVIDRLAPDALRRLRWSGGQDGAYLLLGVSYERTHQIDKALGVYQLGAALFSRNVDLLNRLGELLHASLLDERARPFFERVVSLSPRNTPALLGLAEINHSLGLLDRSAEYYDRALDVLDALHAADSDVWRSYAHVLLEQRSWEAAGLAAQRSLELGGSDESLLLLAQIRRAEGDILEALSLFNAVAPALDPDEALRRDLVAATWHIEAGQWHSAMARVRHALDAEPDCPLARYLRARGHLRAGRRELAVNDLRVAAAGKEPFVAKAAAALLESMERP